MIRPARPRTLSHDLFPRKINGSSEESVGEMGARRLGFLRPGRQKEFGTKLPCRSSPWYASHLYETVVDRSADRIANRSTEPTTTVWKLNCYPGMSLVHPVLAYSGPLRGPLDFPRHNSGVQCDLHDVQSPPSPKLFARIGSHSVASLSRTILGEGDRGRGPLLVDGYDGWSFPVSDRSNDRDRSP